MPHTLTKFNISLPLFRPFHAIFNSEQVGVLMKRSICSVFFLLVLGGFALWLATPKALAQETRGQILGRVVDPSGAVVPGATLKAIDTNTNVETSTTTNDSGDYVLPYLLSGTYNISAEMKGFKTS